MSYIVFVEATNEKLYETDGSGFDPATFPLEPGEALIEAPSDGSTFEQWVIENSTDSNGNPIKVVTVVTVVENPPTLDEQKDEAKRKLGVIADTHKHDRIDVKITSTTLSVPTGTYWCSTSENGFSKAGVIHQRLQNLAAGETVIYETIHEELLDVDLDTFGFFYLRIFNHHQWSDAGRRDVVAQIDASTDPTTMDLQALYDTAYANAKPVGEY